MIPGSAKPFRLCNQCDSCGFLPWKFHWFIYLPSCMIYSAWHAYILNIYQ
jgi:hypothetical protein